MSTLDELKGLTKVSGTYWRPVLNNIAKWHDTRMDGLNAVIDQQYQDIVSWEKRSNSDRQIANEAGYQRGLAEAKDKILYHETELKYCWDRIEAQQSGEPYLIHAKHKDGDISYYYILENDGAGTYIAIYTTRCFADAVTYRNKMNAEWRKQNPVKRYVKVSIVLDNDSIDYYCYDNQTKLHVKFDDWVICTKLSSTADRWIDIKNSQHEAEVKEQEKPKWVINPELSEVTKRIECGEKYCLAPKDKAAAVCELLNKLEGEQDDDK